jgi:hypothetical protein
MVQIHLFLSEREGDNVGDGKYLRSVEVSECSCRSQVIWIGDVRCACEPFGNVVDELAPGIGGKNRIVVGERLVNFHVESVINGITFRIALLTDSSVLRIRPE